MAGVPVREMGMTEAFGTLFERHWETFYRVHRTQFEEFLKMNGFTDEALAKLGSPKEKLAKQWCAAQMTYYLLRYGGVLGVHYLGVGERKEREIKVVRGPPVKTAHITGSRMGRVLEDALGGRQYATPDSIAPFASYGDCDEIAFEIAQGMEAIDAHGNLGMHATLTASGTHALVAIDFFEGKRKPFLYDPTFIGEEDRYPRSMIITASIGDEHGSKEEIERYKKRTIPTINRRIVKSLEGVRIGPDQVKALERAVEFISEQPHGVLALARQANRRLWNRDLREDSVELQDQTKNIAANLGEMKPPYSEEALGVATIYLATFFRSFDQALSGLRNAQAGLAMEDRMKLLQRTGQAIAGGKNVDTEVQAFLAEKRGVVAH